MITHDHEFRVGDEVTCTRCYIMSGKVIKIFSGTGNMLVRTDAGNRVVANPKDWRLLKGE